MNDRATPLDALAATADQADQAAAGPGAPQPAHGAAAGAPGAAPAPPSPNVAAIAFLLSTFRTVAGLMLQATSLGVTLDDAKVQACADVLAPVADKYGLDLGAVFSGPEGAAIMVAGPILWEAARQLSLELKAKRAKPVGDAPADDQAASSSSSSSSSSAVAAG